MKKMKSLTNLPLNAEHEKLVLDYRKYLKVLGYQSYKNISLGVREFLWKQEVEERELGKVSGGDIESYYEYLQNRPSHSVHKNGSISEVTIEGYLYSIRLFYDYLQKIGLVENNPMSNLLFKEKRKYLKEEKAERKVLSKEEMKLLYKNCEDEQERALLGLFYGCGLRKSEAEKLNISDLDFRGMWLYIRSGKGKKRRVIPMTESVVEDFKNYRYDQRPSQESKETKGLDKKAFMLNGRGTRMKGGTYWRMFKVLLKRSGLSREISLHHLRHTIATHLLGGGMRIEEVRDFLGHEHLESTQIYTRVNLVDPSKS